MIPAAKNEFESQDYNKINLVEHDLKSAVFTHCRFFSCDFTKANLTGSRFIDCQLENCNFSLVKLDGCRLQDVRFENCKLVGMNFGKCEQRFLSLKFKGCLIDTSNFSDLDLKNTSFCDCVIRETYFANTNLQGANFSGTDLQGSVFHNSDLSKANFQGAFNYSINPLTNKLQRAKFSRLEVLSLLNHLDIIIE